MGVSSYFEFVTTLFGWIMYDRIWSVLADSGVVYIPFIAILLGNIIQAKKAGDDEGGAALQSLKKSEVDIVIALIVMFLAAVPFTEVKLSEMQYVRPTLDCAIERDIANGAPAVINGANTGTTYDTTLQSLDGEVGRIPIWWGALHVITKAIVSAAIAGIPCTGDVAAIEFRLETDPIEDPKLVKELQEFLMDCYMPALSQYYRRRGEPITVDEAQSTGWLGSSYFLGSRDYYAGKFYSSAPRQEWAFESNRDGGYEADTTAGGHPTCAQWWADAAIGLRVRSLQSLEAETLDDYVYGPDNLIAEQYPGLSVGLREDVLLRKYFAIRHRQDNVSGFRNLSVSYEPGAAEQYRASQEDELQAGVAGGLLNATWDLTTELASNAMAGLGTLISAPGHSAAGVAAREGSTIFVGMIAMVVIALMPLLFTLSAFRLSVLMITSVVFLALQFIYVLWGLAFWVDNSLFSAVVQGGFSGVFNPTQSTILVWVQRFLYLVFPMLWLVSLGWVGHRAVGLVTAEEKLSAGTSSAMQRGGSVAASAVSLVGRR